MPGCQDSAWLSLREHHWVPREGSSPIHSTSSGGAVSPSLATGGGTGGKAQECHSCLVCVVGAGLEEQLSGPPPFPLCGKSSFSPGCPSNQKLDRLPGKADLSNQGPNHPGRTIKSPQASATSLTKREAQPQNQAGVAMATRSLCIPTPTCRNLSAADGEEVASF